MSILKINDDPVAIKHIQTLQTELDRRGISQRQLGKMIGSSAALICAICGRPERTTVPIYNAIAHCFGWPFYNRSRQVMDNFNLPPNSNSLPLPPDIARDVKRIAHQKGFSEAHTLELLLRIALKPYKESQALLNTLYQDLDAELKTKE